MNFVQKISKIAKRTGHGIAKRTRHRDYLPSPFFPLRASVAILFLLLFPLCVQAAPAAWRDLWLTPDQQGRLYFERGAFAQAAAVFRDPLWQGAAWYRTGEFEKAAQAFSRRDTAEAHYNQGNAWLMRGKYETAIVCYDRALEKRPDWAEAAQNRDLAAARAKMTEAEGGDMGDQKIGADKIVFDKNAKNAGQDAEIAGDKALSNQEIQALWLRRVKTRPADFLKAKFAYQQATREETK